MIQSPYDPDDIKARHSLVEEVGKSVALKRSGREMVGLCPFHQEKTASFTVVEDRGFFYCFGCQAHGDVIDFVAQYHNTDFRGACAILDGEKQSTVRPMPRPARPAPAPLQPAPIVADHKAFVAGVPIRAWNPKQEKWASYTPDFVFPYRAVDGDLLGYVLRIDIGADKIILTLRCVEIEGRTEWALVPFDAPRPLYGLQRLELEGPVFLVEGERKADLLAELMGYPVLSWPGGTSGPRYTDFSPLAGRDVVVWSDADEPGEKAAMLASAKVLEAGAASSRLIPWDRDRPKGWDAADAIIEGWERDDVWRLIDDTAIAINLAAKPEPEQPARAGDFDANPFTGELPSPRQWAFGRILLNRTVTALAAPAGTGKTTWALQLGVAFSQHIRFGPFDPIRTGPVWVWNNEDDTDELNRRVLASCTAMNIEPAKLSGKLFLNSGADRALIVAKEDRRTGEIIATPDVARVIEVIAERQIKLLIIDPFAETFEVESENSNDAMKRVARLYRDIAWQTGCCVLLVVHTPKGTNADRSAGDLDAIRGGGAIGGVVRSAWTMFGMTETDAETIGMPAASRHLYVRLDNAKSNMSLQDAEPVWWRKEGIAIGNADNEYPEDVVGALIHQQFASVTAKREEAEAASLDRVSDEIVRVAEMWGWTSLGRAATLDTLAGALNREVTKLGIRATKDLIVGQMGYSHRHGEHLIMLTQEARGSQTIRKIFVQCAE